MDEEYEDEFETYEDDFESESEDARDFTAAQQAAEKPTSQAKGLRDLAGTLQGALPAKADFGLTDLQRSHAEQQCSRWQLLKSQVQLQEAVLDDLFELAPLTQHELYAMGQGPYRNTAVGSCQTNVDAIANSCQTDEVSTAETSCQMPDYSSGQCPAERQDIQAASENGLKDQWLPELESAGSHVLTLLNRQRHFKAPLQFAPAGQEGCFAGQRPLLCADILQGCKPTAMASHPSCSAVVAAHTASEAKGCVLGGMGCLCVWDLTSPDMPSHVLISEGRPSCCTFVACPGVSMLVVAGMQDGGLCLWNCDEVAQQHSQHTIGGKRVTSRRPTFTTECSGASAMTACVVAVASLSNGQPGSGSSQLLALTEWGIVSLWTTMVLSTTALNAHADIGVRTGSNICILLTATLAAGNAVQPYLDMLALDNASQLCMEVGRHAAALAIPPSSSNQFLVGMDTAQILRGSLYGHSFLPKAWQSGSVESLSGYIEVPLQTHVTCLSFSPLIPDVLVAGHSNGACVFYSSHKSIPLLTIQVTDCGIRDAQWSQTRPEILYILNEDGKLNTLSILSQSSLPLMNTQVKGRVAHFQAVMYTVDQEAPQSRKQLIIVAFDDSKVECCLLEQRFVTSSQDECNQVYKALKL